MTKTQKKQKMIAVIGSTAVGKSDLAVHIAKIFNGEVISADSRQVYKNGDLLSGKITKKEMRGVEHYLLNIADIKRQYTVTRFLKDSKNALGNIKKKNKLPIICGGTGMYINALVYNQVFPQVKPNKELRKELSSKTTQELYKILKKIDKKRSENIDTQNPRRLIRAIEIAGVLGSVPEINYNESKYDTLFIGLWLPREELKQNIKTRIEKRMRRGMLKEIEIFKRTGISTKRLEELGLEFKHLSRIYEKKESKETALTELYFDIVHYAKRQETWFKKDKNINWFSPKDYAGVEKLVKDFISK